MKNNTFFENNTNPYGNFYWLRYSMNKPLFDGKIQHADIFRLLYLASYMGYDSNKLIYRNRKPVHKSDLQKLLQLKSSAYKAFMKECEKSNLLIINDDNTILLSNLYFKKGKLKAADYQKQNLTRIYTNSIQALYEITTPREHKCISYLYHLLPYVNVKYNIVCKNPHETDFDKIKFCTLRETCQMVNYGITKSNRFQENFNSVLINNQPVVHVFKSCNGKHLIIHPAVYYAGNIYDEVSIIGGFNKENNPQIKEETL